MPDDQIAKLSEFQASPNTGISPQQFELPFLSAHVTDLSLFKVGVQQKLLRLLKECRFSNNVADEIREHYRLTLCPEIGAENITVARTNLRRHEERLADRLTIVADTANELLEEWRD